MFVDGLHGGSLRLQTAGDSGQVWPWVTGTGCCHSLVRWCVELWLLCTLPQFRGSQPHDRRCNISPKRWVQRSPGQRGCVAHGVDDVENRLGGDLGVLLVEDQARMAGAVNDAV
jgi:hypothetical protein